MKFFSKVNIIRLALAAASISIILLLLPRADHQSYSYELNQPWKYSLLTAEFDVPILLDSMSAARLKDSIDANFIPFVKRDEATSKAAIERFSTLIEGKYAPKQELAIKNGLAKVYSDGLIDAEIYKQIRRKGQPLLRQTDTDNDGSQTVTSIDASLMLSPSKAFEYIDSLFHASDADALLGEEGAKALNICLIPNVVLDTIVDSKFRNQEYLNVTGAQGIIKKGQRIVDVGEIITPQIYTNLNTYQDMLNQRDDDQGIQIYHILGQFLYLTLIISLLYFFLSIYRQRFYSSIKKMTFLMTFITFFVVFAIVMYESMRTGLSIVPFAALPVITLVFFDSRTAIYALGTAVLMAALVATSPFQFIFMELAAGLAATFSIHQLSKRSQLLNAAALTFLMYTICYTSLMLIAEGNLLLFSWRTIICFAVNAVIFSFAYVLIFVVEKTFGFTSTVTLVELSDINSPILRRLSEEAPGTFQHSMQVSMLASEAARAIDANTQLVRTGALYHDIGKLDSPIFYTENQHGVNPHTGLDPETSAKKIISHVTAGLSLAAKEKLPAEIRNFISQHHGRGMAKYFYTTACNASPDGTVDKKPFTYPGPNPQSKETAIVLMADTIEAASRSLKEYTTESINNLVDKIIDAEVAEGLFREAPISLKDIETVKTTFKKRLATIYHSRVAYPELKSKPKD